MNQVEAQFSREFTQDLLNCPLCYAFALPIDPHADWAPDPFRIISRPVVREISISKIHSI
jgi:hypothetical protein